MTGDYPLQSFFDSGLAGQTEEAVACEQTLEIPIRKLKNAHSGSDSCSMLEIQWMPISDAADQVLRGEWNDGKTALALWRAQHHLQL